MPRVLHLCPFEDDFQTRASIKLLLAAGDEVRTIGRGGDFSTLMIGLLRFRKAAADFELIHAWGPDALTLAALGSSRKIIYSPTRFPNRHDLRWLRSTLAAREVQIICPTQTMRRRFVRNGVPIEQCDLVQPGVDFSRIGKKRDGALRERLGLAPDDYVILASGESIHGANHHASILTACVLNVYDTRYKLMLWGRGPQAQKEIDFCNLMWPVSFVRIASARLGRGVDLPDILPAADAVLITADGPVPTLPVATCMAASLPIVSVVTPTLSELLEDRRSALMTRECRSRILAKRFLDLKDDPKLGPSLGDQARNDVFRFFSGTRFTEQVRQIYERSATGKSRSSLASVGGPLASVM